MLMAFALLFGLSAGAPIQLAATAGTEVDVELVLAVDVSGSMDAEEIAVQRSGYAEALRHPDFIDAVRSGLLGRVALSYFEWAGSVDGSSLVDWQLIETPADADAFADRVSARNVERRRGTSISSAIGYGTDLLHGNRFDARRKVIDISGDGPNNAGQPVLPARDAALSTGIVINGLAIMIRPSGSVVGLDRYYGDCVIGGPGSFVLPVHDPADFTAAIRRKLVMEISALPPHKPAIVPIAAPTPTDCMIGEKLRYGMLER